MGAVRCQRGYYYCSRCGAGHVPWDHVLGFTGPELTPGAEQLVSLAGCLDSFAEANQKILPRLSGIRVAESTVERTTERSGQRVGELLAGGLRFGPAADWKWHVDAEGKRGSYLTFASVFRREGKPCPRCGTAIVKMRAAGRGTHICPHCQVVPKEKS
jgi:hypothetical protein